MISGPRTAEDGQAPAATQSGEPVEGRSATTRLGGGRLRGYTLNEMLIVLAVLAALAAMAWPSLRKPLAKHRLTSAAKQLRAELAGMRLKAIHRGQPLQFRYVPGTGQYCLEPLGGNQPAMARANSSASAWEGGFSNAIDDLQLETVDSAAQPARRQQAEEGKLPEDVLFADTCEWGSDLLESVKPAGLETELLKPSRGALSDKDWSAPIVFYPNGRVSDAEISLVGDRNYRIRLNLRGITGAITVSAVEYPSEDHGGQLELPNPTVTADARQSQDARSSSRWSPHTLTR